MQEAMPDLDPTTLPDAPALTADERSAHAAPAETHSDGWLSRNLPLSLDAYEKAALERALFECWGDAAEAARMLGIGRSTFYRKAGKHGIHLGRVRAPSPSPAPESEAPAAPIGVGPPEPLG